LRKSIRYKNWRQAVIERDNYVCWICGSIATDCVAHHIKPWANYPILRFVVENGITLCQPCHIALHSTGYNHSGNISETLEAIKAAL